MEASIEWFSRTGFAVMIDGNDIIHVNNIDRETGDALAGIFESTAEEAPLIVSRKVNLQAHKAMQN
ncbi:hypothetical protein SPF06_18555 [Sinomonas sp. JGH33]|uniref:Uncharacterized protein n=1 Tax=Sinomonas terricola TaxID=3110330 RepID=A0ABU5TAN5_9MICC|nr:hypothetical protein [Sinomonas sp. JGH33]MEA5456729.1 hypothetical protein [Sinomonas sp. JGH33]